MNKGILTVGVIMLGLLALLLIGVINNASTGSELDYYLVKETSEAAMIDAIDVSYYRLNGQIRMDKERFVESFLRRFADSVDNTRNYKVSFYDLNETPPKVSVKVDSATSLTFNATDIELSTNIDAILESKYGNDQYVVNGSKDGTLGSYTENSKGNEE